MIFSSLLGSFYSGRQRAADAHFSKEIQALTSEERFLGPAPPAFILVNETIPPPLNVGELNLLPKLPFWGTA